MAKLFNIYGSYHIKAKLCDFFMHPLKVPKYSICMVTSKKGPDYAIYMVPTLNVTRYPFIWILFPKRTNIWNLYGSCTINILKCQMYDVYSIWAWICHLFDANPKIIHMQFLRCLPKKCQNVLYLLWISKNQIQ